MEEQCKSSILEELFYEREMEKLCELNEEEKKVRNEVRVRENEHNLDVTLESIEDKEFAEKLSKEIDFVIDDILYQMGVTLKKYYIEGFKDGIKVMKECYDE